MQSLNIARLLALPAVLVIGCQGTRPPNLGLRDGKLAPCPGTPNCVSSQSQNQEHRVTPLTFAGPAEDALSRLKSIIRDLPRTRIVAETQTYLYAEFTSPVFRFVDDVEFFIDTSANIIHVRSASRLGKSDLGVNRKRIEKIRALWNSSAGR